MRCKLASSPAVLAQFNAATDGRGNVRDWLADLLLKKLEIVPSRESSVVEISFKGADPQFVAAVANAFADEYQRISVLLKTEPMKKASTYFNEQTKLLRDNVETAQARLSKYQQEKGIVSLDFNRVDVELARLDDLSQQLVAAQTPGDRGQLARAHGARHAVDSPDVANNALVQNMRGRAWPAPRRSSPRCRSGWRTTIRNTLSAKAEVDKMRADLNAALGSVSRSVGDNAAVLRQRESELRGALAAQKVKVLELNRARDELGVLLKDMDSAQRAFDAASQRLSQTRIEASSEQSDISILNPATPPMEPSGPRVLLNTLVSVLLGTVLGVGISLLIEMLNRPIRSAGDMKELLGGPCWARSHGAAAAPRARPARADRRRAA